MSLCYDDEFRKYDGFCRHCDYCINNYKKTEQSIKEMEEKLDEEKFGFDYLDCWDERENGIYVIKMEYVGDDMEYKDEEDFEDMDIWRTFRNKQYEVKEKHFNEMLKEMKKIHINFDDYDYDDYDYPCVYIYFKLEVM